MRARASLIVTAAAVCALGGCRDSGLPDRNLPHEQAAHRAPDALVQAVHPGSNPDLQAGVMPGPGTEAMAARPVTLGDESFLAAGGPLRVEAGSLRAVGSGAMGGTFSAASWDEPPYERLYLSHPGGLYVTYLPVRDAGDPAARAVVARHALEGGAEPAH